MFKLIRFHKLFIFTNTFLCFSINLLRGSQEYITYELVPTSPVVSCMSGSSSFDSFRDGWSYSSVGCGLQDLFNIARSILM